MERTDAAVPGRTALLLSLVIVAMPARAHGEHLPAVLGVALYVVPALALLLVPWHAGWARLLTTAVLAAGVVFLWSVVLPRIHRGPMSTLAQWSILLSPTLLALALAFLLRRKVPRGSTSR